MAFILDLVGSMAIRGAIVLIVLKLVLILNTTLYDRTALANTNVMLGATSDVMYRDIRLAGYNVTATAFTAAEPTDMQFNGDVDNNGSVDAIRIYGVQDGTTQLWKVYRVVNGGAPLMIGSGLMSFSFVYKTRNSVVITTPSDSLASIAAIQATLVGKVNVLSSNLYLDSSKDTTATREFRVFPMNL